MPSRTVVLTVVLPTAGRPAAVRRLLTSLARQQPTSIAWDVVVVDNDPRPHPAVQACVRESGLSVHYVHEPLAGASAARNRGIAAASGAWTALLDDDVVPAPDWLVRVAGHLDGDLDGFGGRVVLDPTVPLPGWMDRTLAGFVTALDLGPDARPLEAGEYVLTANAVVRTEVLRQFPFDPRLGPRPGAHLTNDDLDLVARMQAADVRLGWAPDVVVVHDAPAERLTARWLAARAFQQGRSDRRLEAPNLVGARLGGLRTGWWHLQDRTRRSVAASERRSTAGAHVLAQSARALGWWVETLADLRQGRP